MPRAKQIPDDFDTLTEAAAATRDPVEQQRLKAKARKTVIQKQPKKTGRPTAFNPKVADQILSRIANGETLTKIAETLNIPIQNFYNWMDNNQGFLERYHRSREQQARTLVDKLIEETEGLENDRALAVRVRADVIRWVAQRYNPQQFSDSKRIELSGEVNHTHIHQLAPAQRRRIAEAWLMSQTDDDTPGITSETTGPALPAMALEAVGDRDNGVLPTRRKAIVRQSGRRYKEEAADW